MSKRTHLAESQVPLTEGQRVWTLCQIQIQNAFWMFRWLPGQVNEKALNSIQTCPKCIDAVLDCRNQGDHTYMYGVRDRAEMSPKEVALIEAALGD